MDYQKEHNVSYFINSMKQYSQYYALFARFLDLSSINFIGIPKYKIGLILKLQKLY